MAEEKNRAMIINIIREYLLLLKKHDVTYKKVYLFGSQVSGNVTDDSDIDLAIVSDDFSGDTIEDSLYLMKLRRQVDSRIEPHPFLTSDFSEDDPFVLEIIRRGELIEEN